VLQFDQVAQLTIALPNGKTRTGSGYLVAERLVLTAGHVVDEAPADATIDVKFPAADATATGTVLWSGPAQGLDAALVELNAVPEGPVRIRGDRGAVGAAHGAAAGGEGHRGGVSAGRGWRLTSPSPECAPPAGRGTQTGVRQVRLDATRPAAHRPPLSRGVA
jgi:hypothetical protein